MKLNCGFIYRIICNQTGEVYIGSSTTTLEKRIKWHESPLNTTCSKQIIERGNYDFEKLQICYFETKRELLQMEQECILQAQCINKKAAFRSEAEKKKIIKENNRKWRTENPEYAAIYGKKYRQEFSDYGKKYYEKNMEKLKEYHMQYKLNSPVIKCECGSAIKKYNLKQHCKTKKHQSK